MMNYFSIFIVSFTIALSGALAPGPLLTAVIYESTRKGFKAGPLVILGHALLEVIILALIISGLAGVLFATAFAGETGHYVNGVEGIKGSRLQLYHLQVSIGGCIMYCIMPTN